VEQADDDRWVGARDVWAVTCVTAGALGRAPAAGRCGLAAGGPALAAAGTAMAAAEVVSCRGELVSANAATALDATITASAADPVSAIPGGAARSPWPGSDGADRDGTDRSGGYDGYPTKHSLGLGGVEALVRVLAEQSADHRPQRPAWVAGSGSSATTAVRLASAPASRSKGPRPSTAAYSETPSPHRSAGGPDRPPRARSGAM
jgi:hypothetical protein